MRFDSKAAHGRSLAILTPMNVLLQTAPIILLSFLVKIGVDALPGAAVRLAFAAIPARLAAFYWGVPLCPDDLSFSVQGLTFVVARSCAATDFFSMAAALLVWFGIRRRCGPWIRAGWGVGGICAAWSVTVLANAVRLIALVPVERAFPKESVPSVHLAVGVFTFLPILIVLWYNTVRSQGKENRDELRQM